MTAGRRRSTLGVIALFVLAACSNGGGGGTAEPTTAPGAATSSSGASPSTTAAGDGSSPTSAPPAASATIVLGFESIGVARFGEPRADVLARVSAVLGAPELEGPGCELAGPAATIIRWPQLTLELTDGVLDGYSARPPSTLETEAGIGLGDSVADLRAAYGPDVVIPGLPPEFDENTFAITSAASGSEILGGLSSTDDDGVIQSFFTSVCE